MGCAAHTVARGIRENTLYKTVMLSAVLYGYDTWTNFKGKTLIQGV